MKDSCIRRISLLALFSIVPLTALAAKSSVPIAHSVLFDQRERAVSRNLTRASEFVDVPHISWQTCEQVVDPVALATPDPILAPAGRDKKVRVSFIIGTDGHVHSPLILESAGMAGDRLVLDTVRHWRYRPGTCNGVPADTEGKIEFLVH